MTLARTSSRPSSSASSRSVSSADATNQLLCKTFLENALRDPVSGEIGKSIIFAVSQNHASKLAQILNQMADRMFPGKYQSDFAVQVTSQIPDAQQFTINFANNNLLGSGNFIPAYKTSKARICVTVGMMTTGYDCTDILNLVSSARSFRPLTSSRSRDAAPASTTFREVLFDDTLKEGLQPHQNRLQALRLLRQLRILRGRVQLRRSAEAPACLRA
jgi:type I restriction enzyme R subunit